MKEYFSLNKSKFLFQFIVNSVILCIVWTFIIMFDKQGMSPESKVIGYIFFAIPLTILSSLFINIGEMLEFKRTNEILSNEPFSKMLTDGFIRTFSDKDSRYVSSKPILTGFLYGYDVKIEIEKKVVRVIFNADLDLIEKAHMTELKSIFGKDNVEYDVGVALLFRPSRQKNLLYQDLKNELNQFVTILKTNKIKPWDENGSA